MKSLEHEIQKAFFAWVNLTLYRSCIFAIPNGGMRHIGVARKLKAEGVTPGVFDVFVAIPTETQHGLWIEFKSGKNKLTEYQKAFMRKMTLQDYTCVVCYSLEEAKEALQRYLHGEESLLRSSYLAETRKLISGETSQYVRLSPISSLDC